MTAESFLKKRLQKFSILDLALIKLVYFVIGLLVASLYPQLIGNDWLFYLIISLFCATPLLIHLFAQKGNYSEKLRLYLKTNNPSNQMLLFLSTFFFALMVACLAPILTEFSWWIYLAIIVACAIKPLQTSWVW